MSTHKARQIPRKCGTEGVKVWNWGGESVELRGWYPFSSPVISTTYAPSIASLPSHPPYGGVSGAVTGPSTLNPLTTNNRAKLGEICGVSRQKGEGVVLVPPLKAGTPPRWSKGNLDRPRFFWRHSTPHPLQEISINHPVFAGKMRGC